MDISTKWIYISQGLPVGLLSMVASNSDNVFSQRVINEWNKLPNDCVNASSVNMFKNRIDRYPIRAGYT